MSRVTFVIDFKDGEEQFADTGTKLLGGEVAVCRLTPVRDRWDPASIAMVLMSHGIGWAGLIEGLATTNGWRVWVRGNDKSVIQVPHDQYQSACEIVNALCPAICEVVVRPEFYSWIEGCELPDWAMSAAYDTGAGKTLCAVCEVNEELQRQGWSRLVWAYLDLPCSAMICRNTGRDISQYVVRWLPVDGASLNKN